MHQTTVRFGAELWADLEREAARGGVSVAQYVREAATARLAHAAARRGAAQFDPPPGPVQSIPEAMVAQERSRWTIEGSSAVLHQSARARARAAELRRLSREARAKAATRGHSAQARRAVVPDPGGRSLRAPRLSPESA
jgi:hypothetical protein